MAIEALITPKNVEFAHLPSHDLESILYVILYICTFTQGPCQSLRLDFDVPESLYMKSWFSTDSVDVIGFRKVGHMSRPEQTIIPGFTKYWEDFIPYALELIRICFPPEYNTACPNHLTHEKMLVVLEKAYCSVKEPDKISIESSKPIAGVKRTRQSGGKAIVVERKKRKLEKSRGKR